MDEETLLAAEADADDGEENFEIDLTSGDAEELPFACHLCRDRFKLSSHPVVTLCNHYFCTDCIVSYSRKSTKCPICDKAMHAVFNRGEKVIKKLMAESAAGSSSEESGGGEGTQGSASNIANPPRKQKSRGFVDVT